jgi:beta-glucosidase
MPAITFPADFVWGTASSSHQSEGGNVHNDWWDWEQQPGHIAHGHTSGRGNDFWNRYDGDFALLAELGLKHYRLSVEWSRVEPEEGRVDGSALAHYQRMLSSARDRGIVPWVNLHHFALPRWFAAKGGFLHDENLEFWKRHVERVARALAPLCSHWHPINEANAYAAVGFLLGIMPPGQKDFSAFRRILRNTMLQYRDAHSILKSVDPTFQVGTIHVFNPVFPADPSNDDDVLLAQNFDGHFNAVPLHALKDGVIALPGSDPEPVEGLRGAADFFGANYYAATCVSAADPDRFHVYPPNAPRRTQLGNAPYPDGLLQVLRRVRDTGLDIPIYVAENGIGTDDDAWRIDYVREHLRRVAAAIEEGCDVRGYFHWTSVDNFEWVLGWTAQFGLIGFDPETFERRPKPSAQWLGEVARTGVLRLE